MEMTQAPCRPLTFGCSKVHYSATIKGLAVHPALGSGNKPLCHCKMPALSGSMDGQHPIISSNARVTITMLNEPFQALEFALLCSKVDWERERGRETG